MTAAPWKTAAIEATLVTTTPIAAAVMDARPVVDDDDVETSIVVVPDDSAIPMNLAAYNNVKPQFDREDVFIPQLRLAQGLTEDVINRAADVGQWLLQGYAPKDFVDVAILGYAKMRALYNRETKITDCRSDDAKHGIGTPGGDCEQCPLAEWGKRGANGKGTPPACGVYYSYQAVSLTHGSPCVINLRNTALNAGKSINSTLAMRGFGGCIIRIGSSKTKNDKGTFAVPTVTSRDITPADKERVASLGLLFAPPA